MPAGYGVAASAHNSNRAGMSVQQGAKFISSFLRGTSVPAYLGADDFDGNNTVDSADFSVFVSNFLHSLPNTRLLN
jgi:hypothetical protein